ncbi:MAG TPA: ECF-type sigma factor [Planctomycetota bacterium]|nr:ECF-type sigma factor [Planctomycetota bacterium]
MALLSHPDAATSETAPCADLFLVVYDDLRKLAHARLRRLPPNHELEPTELVHDVFLRVRRRALPAGNGPIEARARFFAAAARVMRDILVEHTRRQMAMKRGGDRVHCCTDTVLLDVDLACMPQGEFEEIDLLALDEALQQLARVDELKHEVVLLRFFMQLSQKEVAEVLQVCERTVERNWSLAKAWLHQQLCAEA